VPRVKAKVLKTKIVDGQLLARLQFNKKLPRVGEIVTVKWGSTRTLQQNAFLWTYYSWLLKHGGIQEHGFFCVEAIHSSMKAHFLSEKIMTKGEWKAVEEGSSTLLNKLEFGEFMERIDSFIVSFFGIDTSAFWQEYEKNWKM